MIYLAAGLLLRVRRNAEAERGQQADALTHDPPVQSVQPGAGLIRRSPAGIKPAMSVKKKIA